jgi:hypothetical protein
MSAFDPRRGVVFWSLAVAGGLAACNSQPPATPGQQPLITGSPAVAATAAPGALPSADAGFRDDFDGASLSEQRWRSLPQTGMITLKDGVLELLNPGNQPNFPYLYTRPAIIPAEGPFYFEFKYRVLALGSTSPSFCLDYAPVSQPGEAPIAEPFMRLSQFYFTLKGTFSTESGPKAYDVPGELRAFSPGEDWHRVRLENDGSGKYRFIVDQKELATFTSTRRPQKFWIGTYPVKDTDASSWPRLQFDYVAAGALGAPDPAQPVAPPSPAAQP